MTYCTDTDLLHWEPQLFVEAAAAAQTLLSGTANLSGAALTLSAGSLVTARVEPGDIVTLTGSVAGAFPIVSVDSATTLSLSVLYDALTPIEPTTPKIPAGTGTALAFAIRSFGAHRRVVTDLLKQAVGIVPGTIDETRITILNPEVLRRPCVLGTLHLIFSALSSFADEPANLIVHADQYDRLFRRAIRSTHVELDLNGDGQADCRRVLGALTMTRV